MMEPTSAGWDRTDRELRAVKEQVVGFGHVADAPVARLVRKDWGGAKGGEGWGGEQTDETGLDW